MVACIDDRIEVQIAVGTYHSLWFSLVIGFVTFKETVPRESRPPDRPLS